MYSRHSFYNRKVSALDCSEVIRVINKACESTWVIPFSQFISVFICNRITCKLQIDNSQDLLLFPSFHIIIKKKNIRGCIRNLTESLTQRCSMGYFILVFLVSLWVHRSASTQKTPDALQMSSYLLLARVRIIQSLHMCDRCVLFRCSQVLCFGCVISVLITGEKSQRDCLLQLVQMWKK